MVSFLSRLINHNRMFKSNKVFRTIDQLRKPQFRMKVTKGSDPCVCPQPPSYVTRLAMPRDYQNVVNFLCATYFKDEPSIINIGLCDVSPTDAMLNLAMERVKHGMTIIALNPRNYIIGAAVNIGSCPWDDKKMIEYARCCEKEGPARDLIEFFAYVKGKPDLWNHYRVLKLFECSILAVDPEYRCIGMAKKLVEESWLLARDCSYRLFRIDCTNRYVAQIAKGFGWYNACTIPYCRYVKNGEMVFKHVQEPHTEVQVYVDTVTYYTTYNLPYLVYDT